MSAVDENANVPVENGKIKSPRGKKGNGGKGGNQAATQQANLERQKAAYEEFVSRNKNKKVNRKNRKKKGNGSAYKQTKGAKSNVSNGAANVKVNGAQTGIAKEGADETDTGTKNDTEVDLAKDTDGFTTGTINDDAKNWIRIIMIMLMVNFPVETIFSQPTVSNLLFDFNLKNNLQVVHCR